MEKINWDAFRAKNENKTNSFESLCYHLFCRKFSLKEGVTADCYDNDFLEEDSHKLITNVPENQSKIDFLKNMKFTEIDILRITRKIKRNKKEDFLKFILNLKSEKLNLVKSDLDPTFKRIEEEFNKIRKFRDAIN